MKTASPPLAMPEGISVRDDKPQVASIRGSRPTMEDRFLILRVQRKNHPVIREHGWLMAVMDGHGGPEAADSVQKNLPLCFQRAFKECKGDYRATMTRAVQLLNEAPEVKYQISAGTTLSMAYAANNLAHVYVAHLGDSPVIVFDSGGHILFRTEEHNIITNPKEVEKARELSLRRHKVDRVEVAEVATRSGPHPHYIKDKRMDGDFEGMSSEILDTIEKIHTAGGAEYTMEQMMADGQALTRIMRGKGVQNIAQLGAYPFDAILSREPDVSQVLIDPNRLPVYLLLATDGVLDTHRGIALPELEKELAHAVAIDHATPADLVERSGGDKAPDNTTVILYKIS